MTDKDLSPRKRKALVRSLLAWYDKNRRRLPWRALPGQSSDPYRVWLSEIMLQQTTVATVGAYFEAFLARWPSIEFLAGAPVEEVMSAWAGLGYYSRARNLHACAKRIVADHAGKMPQDEMELRKLPGIGPYTAAAISAIAFGNKAAPVDGNIERVLARLFAVRRKFPEAKPSLQALATALAPQSRAGDFAQAMMDLGATVCTPKSPSCAICPWTADCQAKALGLEHTLPARSAKKKRPLKRGVAFVLTTAGGELLLRRRPLKGLLAGMHETPTSAWERDFPLHPLALAPVKSNYRKLDGVVRHTFTHFDLELEVYAGRVGPAAKRQAAGEWVSLARLDQCALPTVMRKVIDHALA